MMNQENNALVAGAGGIGGVHFAPTSEYIGMALQELYNWVNNTVIFNTVPPLMRPFYRKIQNFDRWINGYVPEFHDFSKGVIPTHLAKAIVDKVSALIYGGGLMLQNVAENPDSENDGKSETLKKLGDWVQETAFTSVTQSVIKYAVGLGTSCFKLNADGNKELWVEAVPLSRTRYEFDARGDVLSARFFIQMFERDQNATNGEAYGLYEERSYVEGKPYAVYKVYKINRPVNQGQIPTASEVYMTWEELPSWIRKQLKIAFYSIRLDAPILMPFTNLGIYVYRYTPTVSSMPHLRYGDSVLEGLTKYLCEYDIISSCLDTETYVSRARVLAKKNVKNPSAANANYNAGLDSFIMTYYESMGNTEQQLQFIQPEVRAEQFKALRNLTLENIASAVGISPSSFASYLNDNSNRTAREVSAEESSTTLLVENKRFSLLNAINSLLDDVRRYYGLTDAVRGEFSKAGQTNYSLLVENAVRIYQAGGSSLEQFVRTVNPGMDEAQIKREVESIRREMKEKQSASANSLFGSMDDDTDIKDGTEYEDEEV
jgi:hypothetical protein